MTDTPPNPMGMLVIDKPYGWTSMTVCARIRGALKRGGATKRIKVGHAGTLDPLATGILVVLVGKATSQVDRFMGHTKHYVADVDLLHESTTDDFEGHVTRTSLEPPTIDAIRAACAPFRGRILQTPPAHSAIWIDGERAYRLAREGREVEMKARPVEIHRLEVLEYTWPTVRLEVVCSKGTYIRSLARDLGKALGGGGMLEQLRRTAVGTCDETLAVHPMLLPDTLTQDDLLSTDRP
ncbi:MAG: tRNA pseudouridine(55) synthase TruB [Phycisphaerales bacterium]|nr:tRNA pseudouridine(55) synthase TruB [Phycisphaerales bacterium]